MSSWVETWLLKWLSQYISWKIMSSLKCHHSLKISFTWNSQSSFFQPKNKNLHIFQVFCEFQLIFFLSNKIENCLVKRSIVIINIIFILYKLAIMSPFERYPPHLVDNTDTLCLGTSIDNRLCWFLKIFLVFVSNCLSLCQSVFSSVCNPSPNFLRLNITIK